MMGRSGVGGNRGARKQGHHTSALEVGIFKPRKDFFSLICMVPRICTYCLNDSFVVVRKTVSKRFYKCCWEPRGVESGDGQ